MAELGRAAHNNRTLMNESEHNVWSNPRVYGTYTQRNREKNRKSVVVRRSEGIIADCLSI